MNQISSQKILSLPIAGLILFAACILGYSNSFHNGFMLDDHIILFGQKGVSNASFGQLLTSYQATFYRPLGAWYMKLVYLVCGENVVAYHVHNLLLFWVAVFLFFVLIGRMSGDKRLAFVAALLFAVHPINGMLVNYVTACMLTFWLVLCQLSLLTYYSFLQTRKRSFYIWSVVLFVAAIFTHELSFALVAYFFLAGYLLTQEKLLRNVLMCLPFVLIAIINIIWRMSAFAFSRVMSGTSEAFVQPFKYFATFADLIGWYLTKLVYPVDIIFLWSARGAQNGLVWKTILLLIVAVSILWLVARGKKGIRTWALAIFAVGFLPAAFASFTYYPIVAPIIEPHWFYFSSIGFFILVAGSLLKIREKMNVKLWGTLVLCLVLMLVIPLRISNANWHSQRAYCVYWLGLNPWNLTPYYGIGQSYFDEGNYEDALYYFSRGIDTAGYNNVYLLTDSGYCYFVLGDYKLARKFLLASYQQDSNYALTYHYIGVLFHNNGNASASKYFEKAAQLYPRLFCSPERLRGSREIKGVEPAIMNIYAQVCK